MACSCRDSSDIALDKFQCNAFRDNFLLVRFLEKLADRLPSFAAVIQREVVNVHPDKPVHPVRIEAARELDGVVHSFLTVIQAILDALADILADAIHELLSKLAL